MGHHRQTYSRPSPSQRGDLYGVVKVAVGGLSIAIAPLAVVRVFVVPMTMALFGVSVVFPFLVAVTGDVLVVVPLISHEIDRPAARLVFPTMLAPVLLVSGRDMQVDGLD